MTTQTNAHKIAYWADKLRDISALGHHFATNIYDKENYQTIQNLAIEMLALASDKTVEEIEPLRIPHFSRPTPLSVGDAAVIDEERRILLIQRADNQMWAMPGGAFEVGESPAEGAIRETLEETGVHCRAKSLIGVFDSQHMDGESAFQLYHFTFLCEPIVNKAIEPAAFAHETLGFEWFAEGELPSPIDPSHSSRIPKAFQMWRHGGEAFFDNPGG